MEHVVIRQGVNRTAQALRSAGDVYRSFAVDRKTGLLLPRPVQIAVYHGISLENAASIAPAIAAGNTPMVPEEWLHLYVLAYGGIRSGKTFAAAFRLWMMAMKYPGNVLLVARKRKEQLRNTFLNEFEKVGNLISDGHLDYLGELKPERDGAIEYEVYSKGQSSKIIFAIEPDGTDEQIEERWKGYTVSGAIAEEMSQLRRVSPFTINQRVSMAVTDPPASVPVNRWMIGISNPTDRGHWLQKFKQFCLTEQLTGRRPPALVIETKTADNAHNLPAGFEAEQRKMLKDDPIKMGMVLDGLDGITVEGKPVFGSLFNRSIHVDPELRYNPGLPLIRGWDFGFHRPACVWLQEDHQGRLNVLRELLGEDQTADQFTAEVQALTGRDFPDAIRIIDYGDPAGAQKTDKGDTTFMILAKRGIYMNSRPTHIDAGIKHIQNLLARLRAGRPELVFHPSCQDLITAFSYGYVYPEYRGGQIAAKPKKDGYFDHLVDAIRYALVNLHVLDAMDSETVWQGTAYELKVDPPKSLD